MYIFKYITTPNTISILKQHTVICFANTGNYPEQESKFGIPVADVTVLSIRHVHQCHDHLAQAHKGAVDTAGFLH